jgi:hypothetical protein
MSGNCHQEREIGEHNKAIQTLEGQTDELFVQDRKRREEIVETEKKILVMQSSIEEVRAEVHNVAEDVEHVKSSIIDMKSTASAKAEKDRLFQDDVSEKFERLFLAVKENKPQNPKDPEPFKTVKVSRFFAENPKTLIAIYLISGFFLLAGLLIITEQTDHLPELWQGLNPFKLWMK